ncbi:hypothetical protein V8C86DRAFT_2545621 [Haematococcus lacustris]
MAKQRTVEEVTEEVMAYVKPIVHVAFIPVVILVGMLFTKPAPTIGQLLFMS